MITDILSNRWFALIGGLVALQFASASAGEAPQAGTKRIILFVMDGLAVEAPARIAMPNFNKLAKEGTYYKAMHLPLPGHPKNDPRYPWSCSMPNPMLMSGSPFIGTDGIRKAMIQYQFKKEESAFVVNAYSYKDVSGGFGTYVSKPHKPDSLVIDKTKEILSNGKPVFMRVHLQRAGIEGEKVSKEKYAAKPYYRNIWHKESPYRKSVEEADRLLGEFVSWLKKEKLWSDTVLLICGDHGQADEGWHEPYSPPSSVTPLVIVGAGVAPGHTVDQCDIFDIAPTIAALAGRTKPKHAIGRVLSEAFDASLPAPNATSLVEELNKVLRAAQALKAEKKAALKKAGFLTIDELAQWHTTEAGADFKAFVARQKKIYAANR